MAKKFKAITEEKTLKIGTFSLQKIDLLKTVFSSPVSKKDKLEGISKSADTLATLKVSKVTSKKYTPSTRLMIKSTVIGIKDTTATPSKNALVLYKEYW